MVTVFVSMHLCNYCKNFISVIVNSREVLLKISETHIFNIFFYSLFSSHSNAYFITSPMIFIFNF